MTADREKRGSHNGYLTMVNWFVTFKNMCSTNIFQINVRHPLSRLLSAWRDKFRKGHPWMRIIEPKFGKFLEKLERKDMSLEVSYQFYLSHFFSMAPRAPCSDAKNVLQYLISNDKNNVFRCLNIHLKLFWNWRQHQIQIL